VRFAATPTDGGVSPSFQWMVNGVDAGVDSVVFMTDSLRDGGVVSCVMTSSGSCSAPVASNAIAMTVEASPTIVAIRPADTVIAFGQSVGLVSVVAGPVVSYAWTPSVGLNSVVMADPVAMPEVTTVYRLTVMSPVGCLATDSVKVEVYRRFTLPNAFTPNGDGHNDVFRIPPGVGAGLVRFEVYNRLGGRVFFTANVSQGWDGTVGGIRQPAGEYIWDIEYVDVLTGKRVRMNGTVVLVR